MFADFCVLLKSQNISTDLLKKFNFSARDFIAEEDNYNLKVDEEEFEAAGKYVNSLFGIKNQEKIKIHEIAEMNKKVKIKNVFYEPEIFRYLIRYYSGTCPLWSSFFSERTTNATIKSQNRLIKKNILNDKHFLRPARFIKKMRANVLGDMKVINLGIKTKASKKKDRDLFIESWKKPGKKPKYFEKPTVYEDPSDEPEPGNTGRGNYNRNNKSILLTNPKNVDNHQMLWLTNTIIDDFLAVFDSNIRVTKSFPSGCEVIMKDDSSCKRYFENVFISFYS